MHQRTNSEQEDLSSIQSSTKEANKVTYLNEEIIGAKPFKLIGNEEQGYAIAFGKYRVSEIHDTKEKALAELEQEPWLITINLIAATMQQMGETATKDRMK